MQLALITATGTALAEDDRSACATTAEHAQELRVAHRLKEAREKLVDCSKPSCPTIVSQDCAQWLAEVDAIIPSLVIQAADPAGRAITSLSVWIDGQKVDHLNGSAIPIDPGEHKLRFEANAMAPVDQQIVVAEGEAKRNITAKLVPLHPPAPVMAPSPPAPRRSGFMTALPYALASVGVVALGGFSYFAIKGTSQADDLAAGCGATKTCSESQVEPARRHLLMADVSLGISLASLGAATWIFVSRSTLKPRQPTAVQVGVTPGSGVLKLRLDF